MASSCPCWSRVTPGGPVSQNLCSPPSLAPGATASAQGRQALPLGMAGGLLPGEPGTVADRRTPGPPFLPPVWDVPWADVFLRATARGHPGNSRGPWSLLRAYQWLGRVALAAACGHRYLHPVDDTRGRVLLRAP